MSRQSPTLMVVTTAEWKAAKVHIAELEMKRELCEMLHVGVFVLDEAHALLRRIHACFPLTSNICKEIDAYFEHAPASENPTCSE